MIVYSPLDLPYFTGREETALGVPVEADDHAREVRGPRRTAFVTSALIGFRCSRLFPLLL
jgi:hypothetical protein